MKYLLFLILLNNLLLACTGDCLTCHPKLVPTIEEDQRHKPMLTCINCHSPNPNKTADCGADCFACHSMRKINAANVKEHDIIQSCRDCHIGADKKIFDTSNSFNQSLNESLKEFLVQ